MSSRVWLVPYCLIALLGAGSVCSAPFAYIANESSNSVSVIDLGTNAVVGAPIPVGRGPRAAAVNAVGTRVYVTNEFSDTVSVIDAGTDMVIGAPIPVGASPWGIAVNAAGTRVYVANGNGNSVSVIDTATSKVAVTIGPISPSQYGATTAIVLDPAGTRAFVGSSSTAGAIWVIDLATNAVVGEPCWLGVVFDIAINPAGTRLYVATNFGVTVVDTAKNSGIRSLAVSGAAGVAASPDGRYFYVASWGDQRVLKFDAGNYELLASYSVPQPAGGIGIDRSGTRLVAPARDGVVYVIDTVKDTILATVPVGSMPSGYGPFVGPSVIGQAASSTAIEFYNGSLDHYFMTWLPAEVAILDAGTQIKGWSRTGHAFRTHTAPQTATSSVCRYYIPPALGDSHFFGRGTSECETTGQDHPSFVLEDPSFMQLFLPAAGACPSGTNPIYRVFSNRSDANHRYMTSKAVREQMVAKGWLAEGDGPDLVVMCAPQ